MHFIRNYSSPPQKLVETSALPPPPKYVSTRGAVEMALRLSIEADKLLLTHQPKPEPKKPLGLGALLAKQRNPMT